MAPCVITVAAPIAPTAPAAVVAAAAKKQETATTGCTAIGTGSREQWKQLT